MDLMLKPGYINPELAGILRKTGKAFQLREDTDIFALRKQLAQAKKNLTAANTDPRAPKIDERDIDISTRDGSSIKLRIHSPPDNLRTRPTPAFVVLHGGGWCLGDLDNETLLARKWCAEIGGVCVNVDYRLAPEHKFPTAVWDVYDAVKWTSTNAKSLGIDLNAGFIVGGPSAGGNLAATVSQLWIDEKQNRPITGLYLSVPATLSPEAVPESLKAEYRSRAQNADAPVLTAGAMKLFQELYRADPHSPLQSPLLNPAGFKDLPKTYFQICGMDPLRDEAIMYEKALRASGVPTQVQLYPGLPHSFWSFYPDAEFSKQQVRDSIVGLKWLLEKEQRARL